MKNPLPALALLGLVLVLPSGPARAQSTLSAREAVGLVSTQFGPQAVAWIAEMRAQGGVPQPADWQVLAYDERAPRLLYRFWAGGGRAGDGGIDDLRYPDDVPVGYFNPAQIGFDSVAAFTIAEGEARKARVAFDSCNYLLRLREFSTEPVWRLELLDVTRQLAGKIYISGGNGEVLRTVWVYRDQRARPDGQPLIVDSAAPGGRLAPTDLSSTAYPPSGGSVLPGIPAPITSPGRVPAPGTMSGIHSVPLPPTPGVAVAAPPYSTAAPNGTAMAAPSSGSIPAPPPITQVPPSAGSIPAPPPINQAPSSAGSISPPPPITSVPPTATLPPPTIPSPPAVSAPATAPNPKPPIKPSASSAGDSNRIPPPPIP